MKFVPYPLSEQTALNFIYLILGEILADPVSYVERFGSSLIEPSDLPLLVNCIEKLGRRKEAESPGSGGLTSELESLDLDSQDEDRMRILRVEVDCEHCTSDDADSVSDSDSEEDYRDKRQVHKDGTKAQPELEALLEELRLREPITTSSPIHTVDSAAVKAAQSWNSDEKKLIDQIFSYLDVNRTGRIGKWQDSRSGYFCVTIPSLSLSLSFYYPLTGVLKASTRLFP